MTENIFKKGLYFNHPFCELWNTLVKTRWRTLVGLTSSECQSDIIKYEDPRSVLLEKIQISLELNFQNQTS